ncbi:MAG: LytTR family DNA-binding domain-containing protein [Bacteroidota bacterium]
MKGIIVDDEARSRWMLQTLCEEYCEGLDIVGLAASVSEAKVLIAQRVPDVIFLDIRMPVESGFELLKFYNNEFTFDVIFTTAYDEYAVQAFQFAAIDYLLKPIEINDLIRAYESVKTLRNFSPQPEKFEFLQELLEAQKIEKIALTTAEGLTFVNYKDIVRCEGESNYTTIVLNNNTSHLITKTLKHFEDLLLEKDFFRIHKSHLVNLHMVRKFIKSKKGGIVETIDGKRMEVSTKKRETLLERLKNLR